jgi:hypothetical protein
MMPIEMMQRVRNRYLAKHKLKEAVVYAVFEVLFSGVASRPVGIVHSDPSHGGVTRLPHGGHGLPAGHAIKKVSEHEPRCNRCRIKLRLHTNHFGFLILREKEREKSSALTWYF